MTISISVKIWFESFEKRQKYCLGYFDSGAVEALHVTVLEITRMGWSHFVFRCPFGISFVFLRSLPHPRFFRFSFFVIPSVSYTSVIYQWSVQRQFWATFQREWVHEPVTTPFSISMISFPCLVLISSSVHTLFITRLATVRFGPYHSSDAPFFMKTSSVPLVPQEWSSSHCITLLTSKYHILYSLSGPFLCYGYRYLCYPKSSARYHSAYGAPSFILRRLVVLLWSFFQSVWLRNV